MDLNELKKQFIEWNLLGVDIIDKAIERGELHKDEAQALDQIIQASLKAYEELEPAYADLQKAFNECKKGILNANAAYQKDLSQIIADANEDLDQFEQNLNRRSSQEQSQ